MRASVTSLSKKFISTFFAATLALGLVPAAAFAVKDDNAVATIPAGEIINQVEPLQVVAQQESTKSYFLAQTLENIRTVPVVSANLPLDVGLTDDVVVDVGDEGAVPGAPEQAPAIAIESVVVGSFGQDGIVYAIEPGGDSVAVVASDYAKLPSGSIESHTVEIPFMVSSDSIDYYSVTRIADGAFSGLVGETGSQQVQAADENPFVDTNSTSAASDGPDASEDGATAEMSSVDIVSAVVELTDEADSRQPDTTDSVDIITTLVIPASVTTIEDDALAGFTTLQYIVVSPDNPNYSSYDGCLYTADLASLLLIPEGRTGAVRIAPNATIDDSEVFSHCPSGVTLVSDADGAASAALGDVDMKNEDSELAEAINSSFNDELLDAPSAIRYAAAYMPSRPNVYYNGTMYRYYVNTNSGWKSEVASSGSPYDPKLLAEKIYVQNGALCMEGLTSDDATKPRAYYVGTAGETPSVWGVTKAWAVTTNSSGTKSGRWVFESAFKVSSYSALDVYLNDSGFFNIYFNANGGICDYVNYTVCPYDLTITLPTPKREGFIFTGWYTDLNGGTRVTQVGASGGTYYAHWASKTPWAVFRSSPEKPIWRSVVEMDGASTTNVTDESGQFSSEYGGNITASSLRLISNYVEMRGFQWDYLEDRIYRVGISRVNSSTVGGVTEAWVVTTDEQGQSTGFALDSDFKSVVQYAAVAVYLNGYGAFDIVWDPNGGTCDKPKTTGVMPFDSSVDFPVPTKEGYEFKGWFTEQVGGVQVTKPQGAAATYHAQWVPRVPAPVFYTDEESIWAYTDQFGYGLKPPTFPSSTTVSSLKMENGYVEMYGWSWYYARYLAVRVGLEKADDNAVGGVKYAWVVATDAAGKKSGFWLPASDMDVGSYEALDVYLNDSGFFTILFDANGGQCDTTQITVCPYDAQVLFPTPAPREGYIFKGWFTQPEGGTQITNVGGEGATYYAQWIPLLSVIVPVSVGVMLDLTGIEAQAPVVDQDGVQGYIESCSGGALKVTKVDFEPAAGAEALFGDSRNRVLLEALAEGSSSTDYSFALHQAASETDTTKLAPFSLDAGIGTRKRITYRFNIPDDVLLAIDRGAFNNKTTSIGRVSYTVAVDEQA